MPAFRHRWLSACPRPLVARPQGGWLQLQMHCDLAQVSQRIEGIQVTRFVLPQGESMAAGAWGADCYPRLHYDEIIDACRVGPRVALLHQLVIGLGDGLDVESAGSLKS